MGTFVSSVYAVPSRPCPPVAAWPVHAATRGAAEILVSPLASRPCPPEDLWGAHELAGIALQALLYRLSGFGLRLNYSCTSFGRPTGRRAAAAGPTRAHTHRFWHGVGRESTPAPHPTHTRTPTRHPDTPTPRLGGLSAAAASASAAGARASHPISERIQVNPNAKSPTRAGVRCGRCGGPTRAGVRLATVLCSC